MEPLLDPQNRRFTVYPLDPKYTRIWELYQQQLSAFWKAQEVDFSKDYEDFQTLSPQEQQLSRELDILSNRTFESFNLDRPYADTSSATANTQRELVKIAYHKAQHYADNPTGWLYIHGKPGTGKSHLAAAIANYNRGRMSIIYRSMPAMMDIIRENSNALESFMAQIAQTQLVIIDDIGADGKPTDWAEARIFSIINGRVDKPTVFTSNYDVQELPYRDHIRDRLNASRRCWLNTTSIRQSQ